MTRKLRIGYVSIRSDQVLFDPVLSEMAQEAMDLYAKVLDDTGFVCSHCYRRILGKVHRIENEYLDSFCYSMRYSIGYETNERRQIDSVTNDPNGD